MCAGISEALGNSGTVVTANRRLARALIDQFAADQLATGAKAWRSPSILAWPDWLVSLCDSALQPDDLPTRINALQSQVLWERCLQMESYEGPSLAALVRLCRETRQRLADWQVPVRDVARMAQSEDHRLFASVLGRYLGLLEHERWVDDAGVGALVLQLLAERRIEVAGLYTFIGFERTSPLLASIHDTLIAKGVALEIPPVAEPSKSCSVTRFDTRAAELRSAGAWARQCMEINPGARIAIIANKLDQDAETIARHVREGATPGWQHGHPSLYDAVNVSYGLRLASYPAVAVALLLLRWLVDELSSAKVSILLKTPLLGEEELAGRNRLELRLRELPNRCWMPSMITAELRGQPEAKQVNGWLSRLAAFSKQRRELPKLDSPANWAVLFDKVLGSFSWPCTDALGSTEFQLISRWRELLNEFARLGLVSSTMSPRAAVARLETVAGEVIFQPETVNACVHLMGPLEALGLRFDATWITGVTTANWPPAGTPSILVSKRLQEEAGMPHCTPADTLQHAQRVLSGLIVSAGQVVCSYALHEDDAEQTLSDLLSPASTGAALEQLDPGTFAARLLDRVVALPVSDQVAPVAPGEQIFGGAGTIQRQIDDPISAFICGRLGARVINPQALGIPAPLRGKLIHDALYYLYRDLPASGVIRDWSGEELSARIGRAVNYAFVRHEKNADAVLQQLLSLERVRISELMRRFVAVDSGRGDFKVAALEGGLEFVSGHIRLPLRFDRIDTIDDGHMAILDYKTGSAKHLLSKTGEVQEIQLFVYAAAVKGTVSALALVNVDSREIAFEGVGRGFSSADKWPDLMRRATAQIAAACDDMSIGDVRIQIEQGVTSARPLNLLTRYTELRHDNG